MVDRQIAGVFDRAAADYDRIGPQFFAHYGQRLVTLAQIQAGMDVLDVATGTGAILLALMQGDPPLGLAVGVDLSIGMLQQIGKGSSLPVMLGQMDAEHLAFGTGVFDLILCGHAIFFFPQAVPEFYRVLKPGGKVGLTIIARGCFDWLHSIFASFLSPEPDVEESTDSSIDTPNGLTDILAQAGFDPIEIRQESIELIYANEEDWWAWLWTLGFRGALEKMDEEALAAFKVRLFHCLQDFKKADGYHIPFQVLFAFGWKEVDGGR